MAPPPWPQLLADGNLEALAAACAPWARALARVLPLVTLVPALSVRGAPGVARGALALALAAPIAAALPPRPSEGALAVVLARDVLCGVPLALALAAPLWMAAHIGAFADQLRGAPEAHVAPPPATEGARGPLATLVALLAAVAWLEAGGVERALLLLRDAQPTTAIAPWAFALRALAEGLRLSVALSAGVLVGSVALEVALVSMARAAAPVSVQPIAVVARPLVAVLALALSLRAALAVLVGAPP